MTAGARKRRLPWAYRFVAFVLRPLLMRVTKRDWRGLENIPAEGGFVVSTNHISYVDPIVFAHFMFDSGREAYFLGKDSLFAIPVVGWLLQEVRPDPGLPQLGRRHRLLPRRGRRRARRQGARDLPRGHHHARPRPVADARQDRCRPGRARDRCPLIPVAQWGAQEILSPYGHRPSLFPRKTMRCTPVRPSTCRTSTAGPSTRRSFARRPTGSWTASPTCSRCSATRSARPSGSTRAPTVCPRSGTR